MSALVLSTQTSPFMGYNVLQGTHMVNPKAE